MVKGLTMPFFPQTLDNFPDCEYRLSNRHTAQFLSNNKFAKCDDMKSVTALVGRLPALPPNNNKKISATDVDSTESCPARRQ